MRLDSLEALIEESAALLGVMPLSDLTVRATGDRMLPCALGVGRSDDGEYRLAIFGPDTGVVAALTQKARGEVDVYRIERIDPRITSTWAKQPHDILGIGQQVGPAGLGWVGTGGLFVRAAEDANVILQVTNEHVTGEGAKRGRVMHQGGRNYGVVWKVGGLSFDVAQKFDVGTVAVDKTRRINPTYEQGIDNNLRGIRRMTPDDIGRRFTNTGQTRGTMFGKCIAVDVRDIAVSYDGGVARFSDQAAFVGEDGKPFSVGGHSGSTIACVDDGHATALLFAGGPDAQGRDLTFANADLPGAIVAGGGVPELIA